MDTLKTIALWAFGVVGTYGLMYLLSIFTDLKPLLFDKSLNVAEKNNIKRESRKLILVPLIVLGSYFAPYPTFLIALFGIGGVFIFGFLIAKRKLVRDTIPPPSSDLENAAEVIGDDAIDLGEELLK